MRTSVSTPGFIVFQKESNVLTRDPDRSQAEVLNEYRQLFSRVGVERDASQYSGQTPSQSRALGDISTTYAMAPLYPDVADRARALLGPDLKIIYCVREPVARALSHHRHLVELDGRVAIDLDANIAARNEISLVDYSRYAWQLEKWLAVFPAAQVRVVSFERYVANRWETTCELWRFLGVEPLADSESTALDNAGENRAEDRRIAGQAVHRIHQSSWFRRLVQPWCPPTVRAAMRKILLRKPRNAIVAADPGTRAYLSEKLQADGLKLKELLGLQSFPWEWSNSEGARHGVLEPVGSHRACASSPAPSCEVR